MRIAVTGHNGQVARALAEIGARHGHEIVLLGRPTLDLADPSTIEPALREARPEAVINAAAYTAVDKAESEPDLALSINGAGASAIASAAAALGVPVLQVSTDYVFDGSKPSPYVEDDAVGPLGAYGRSKLEGERAVAVANPRHAILRTAWVYAPYGTNFVRTMLRIAGNKPEVSVVADQHGCPTSALDIATTLLAVAAKMAAEPDNAALTGVFHMAARGEAVWADVAEAVFAASRAKGGPSAEVKRITTAEFPTQAKRPANSRLDCTKLDRVYGISLPEWRGPLERTVVAPAQRRAPPCLSSRMAELWDDVPDAPPGPPDRAGDDRRAAKPAVSPESLMRMASYYLARYSASTARLRSVLERKVRRRCALREAPVPEPEEMRALIDGVVERLTRAGLIDDATYARSRAAALARKGFPAWRIKAELQRQDIDTADDGVADAVDLDESAQAARLAQRKRLGPYRPGERAPYRDKDIRALVRAGFPVGVAKRVVDGEAE